MNIETTYKSSDAPARLALHSLLFAESATSTYAVLDGASIGELLPKFREYKPEHVCLYRGEIAPDLAECAPYLVLLKPETSFTNWLLSEGWGKHWGVFATSSATFDTVRIHFRKFLMVRDPQGKRLYFRYYDPRVLRVYLPTCEPAEIEVLFGRVDQYICEGEQPDVALSFHVVAGLPKQDLHRLDSNGRSDDSSTMTLPLARPASTTQTRSSH